MMLYQPASAVPKGSQRSQRLRVAFWLSETWPMYGPQNRRISARFGFATSGTKSVQSKKLPSKSYLTFKQPHKISFLHASDEVHLSLCDLGYFAQTQYMQSTQCEMWAMVNLEELKAVIISASPDAAMATSACSDVDAFYKAWPYVFKINDWDVWNERKRALRLQVVRWLEDRGGAYEFRQLQAGWGFVGFKDLKAATHFKLRWSGQGSVRSASAPDWNPQPLRSTFEAASPNEVPLTSDMPSRQPVRFDPTAYRGSRAPRRFGQR
ncbi:hypothetical protein AAII07_30085 [Microvirga sp. 0TCS3.31]